MLSTQFSRMLITVTSQDCGELTNEAAAAATPKPDTTGDPYEDYPEDQPGHDSLTPQQILKIASEVKEFGNKAFKSSDLVLGIEKYQKALRYLNEYPSATAADAEGEKGEENAAALDRQLASLRFACHSNSALLHNKLAQYDEAKSSGDKAIAVVAGEKGWKASKGADAIGSAERAKAYYRRAMAKNGLKDEDDAIKDLEEALKLKPDDAGIAKDLEGLRKKLREADAKQKKAYKRFFD